MAEKQFKLVDLLEKRCPARRVTYKPMRVARDVMNDTVRTLTLDHTVDDYIKFMKTHKVRHAPVVDLPTRGEEKPYFVGVVSDRDVLRLSSPGADGISAKTRRKLLGQIVARHPKTVTPETATTSVINTMVDNRIDMVPVLEGKDVVGIITTTDIVRLYNQLEGIIRKIYPEAGSEGGDTADSATPEALERKFLWSWIEQTVEKIMTKEVVCMDWQDTIGQGIDAMQQGNFRHLPILDAESKIVGVVSDRDVLRYLPSVKKRPQGEKREFGRYLFDVEPDSPNLDIVLRRIMTMDVICEGPEFKAYDVATIFWKKKIGCLPIVTEDKMVAGIVTVTDLIRRVLDIFKMMGGF